MAEKENQGATQDEQQSSGQGSETPPAGAQWAEAEKKAEEEGGQASQESETGGGASKQKASSGTGQAPQSKGGGQEGGESKDSESQPAVAPLEGGEPEGATWAQEQSERFSQPGAAEREAREKEA